MALDWNLENSVALGREGTGLATIIKQPTLKELTTSPYEALARKKAATVAKPDMSLYKDLTNPIPLTGIYEVDKPEFVERVNGFVEKSAKLYADRSNGNIKEEDAQKLYTELAKERNQILSDIDRSKQDNLVYPKYQLELANKSHLYNPESKNYLETEMALPLSQRKPNLSIAKGDYFDYNKYVRDGMGKNWETWSRGSFSGRGGGSSKGATEFDENKARASWQAFADAQTNDPKLANFMGNAADKMEKEFDKDSKLQKQYNATSWFDLTDDQRLELTDKKAEQMAVNISKELFVKNSKSLSRGDRPRDNDGGGSTGSTGDYEVKVALSPDGTYKKIQYIHLNTVAGDTSKDAQNPQNYFRDKTGKTLPKPAHPTGMIRKDEGGIWMIQLEALDTFTDPISKRTINAHDTFEVPYSQNEIILKKYGYKTIDQIKSPKDRKDMYDKMEPVDPDTFNQNTTDPTERANYKKNYEKWKASGWKNTSTAMVNPTQPKKVGTYNPLTGQIDFA
jgi:hypothetical protein